ncbi:glycerophosphodiester phosphodiesterase family protein [Sphingomicrobium marinum]|uniref:glycerophosphodiester phosphodiesterase family protein n=1 Tax=Sphingomicrobium marinum TaxID=1227950 RepID=UPI00223F956E|nr:glycerophosphodiester phosphodiesterase family protein [Sphingomicrobium marinum]
MPAPRAKPVVIAHRGASAERPEHTLEAYARAIALGADYIEPDLVATRDGHLVARHEAELSGTTDIADRKEFAERKSARTINGREVTGWFAHDLTLAELKRLRARERLPLIRPGNARFNGQFQIPTFAEIVTLARSADRRVGVYPELKTPSFLMEAAGIDVVALMAAELRRLDLADADAPVFVQCFETAPLQRLATLVDTPRIMLLGQRSDAPDEMATIATFASGIGANIQLLLEGDLAPTSLVEEAHAAGLLVHGWTLRAENIFLPERLRKGDIPADLGDYATLWNALIATGADGFFIDNLAEWNALAAARD